MKETSSTFRRCKVESVSISRVFRTRHIESCETKHLQSSLHIFYQKTYVFNVTYGCQWMPFAAWKQHIFWFPLVPCNPPSSWHFHLKIHTWVIWSFMFASDSVGISTSCFRWFLSQSLNKLAEFQPNVGCQKFQNDFDPRHLLFVRSLHSHKRFDVNLLGCHKTWIWITGNIQTSFPRMLIYQFTMVPSQN